MFKLSLPVLHAAAILSVALAVAPTRGVSEILPPLSPQHVADWHAIGVVNVEGPDGMALCSGTLIAPDLVLTAAHCAPNKQHTYQFVTGGIGATTQDSVPSVEIQHHPAYTVTNGTKRFQVDIALITLARGVAQDVAAPLALAPFDTKADQHAILAYHRMRPKGLNGRFDCARQPASGMVLGCQVIAGNSGSPALIETPLGWQIVGVVTARLDQGTSHNALVAPIDQWVRAKLERHLQSKQ